MKYINHTLPVCPNKSQIAHHFGYRDVHHFFTKHFFTQVLPDCRCSYEDIRWAKRLPPDIAQELYHKYQIAYLKSIEENLA